MSRSMLTVRLVIKNHELGTKISHEAPKSTYPGYPGTIDKRGQIKMNESFNGEASAMLRNYSILNIVSLIFSN